MKKLALTLLLIFSSLNFCFSQVFVDEKTQQAFEVVRNNDDPDAANRYAVYGGLFGFDGVSMIGTSYYYPKKLYVNLQGGPNVLINDSPGLNIFGSLSLLFLNKKVLKEMKQVLHSESNIRYIAKVPIPKRKSLGFTIGGGYNPEYSLGSTSLKGPSISAGLTLLTAWSADLMIRGGYKRKKGTSVRRINADIVYYPNPQYLDETNNNQIENSARKIGCRLYMDGRTALWTTGGHFALQYILGAGISMVKSQEVSPLAGLGFSYSW